MLADDSNPFEMRNDFAVSIAYDDYAGADNRQVYVFFECAHARSGEMRFRVFQSSRLVYKAIMREHDGDTDKALDRFICQYHGVFKFPDIEVQLEPCSWVETNRRDGVVTEVGFSMAIGGILQCGITERDESVYIDTRYSSDGDYVSTVYMTTFSTEKNAYTYKPVRVMYGSSEADPMEVFHDFSVEEFERKNGRLQALGEPWIMTEEEYAEFTVEEYAGFKLDAE